jgi:hypothetical protein
MDGFATLPDFTHWPIPSLALNDLEDALRHGQPTLSQRLQAAAIIGAYRQLVNVSGDRRADLVRWIRAAQARAYAPTGESK